MGCRAVIATTIADDPALLADLRAQRSLAEPRLEALRLFTRAVLATRGAVPDDDLAAFVAAGFTRQQALDVVPGVATYADHVRQPPDPHPARRVRAGAGPGAAARAFVLRITRTGGGLL